MTQATNRHHALHQSASFSATIRVRLENHPGAFAALAGAIAGAEGLLGAIDLVRVEADHKIRDVAVLAADAAHLERILAAVREHRGRRDRALVGPDVPSPPRGQARGSSALASEDA